MKKFTSFTSTSALKPGDYIVGYDNTTSEEIRLDYSRLVDILDPQTFTGINTSIKDNPNTVINTTIECTLSSESFTVSRATSNASLTLILNPETKIVNIGITPDDSFTLYYNSSTGNLKLSSIGMINTSLSSVNVSIPVNTSFTITTPNEGIEITRSQTNIIKLIHLDAYTEVDKPGQTGRLDYETPALIEINSTPVEDYCESTKCRNLRLTRDKLWYNVINLASTAITHVNTVVGQVIAIPEQPRRPENKRYNDELARLKKAILPFRDGIKPYRTELTKLQSNWSRSEVTRKPCCLDKETNDYFRPVEKFATGLISYIAKFDAVCKSAKYTDMKLKAETYSGKYRSAVNSAWSVYSRDTFKNATACGCKVSKNIKYATSNVSSASFTESNVNPMDFNPMTLAQDNYILHNINTLKQPNAEWWTNSIEGNKSSIDSLDRTDDFYATGHSYTGIPIGDGGVRMYGIVDVYKRVNITKNQSPTQSAWVPIAQPIRSSQQNTGFGWRVEINSSFSTDFGRVPTSYLTADRNKFLTIAVTDIGWDREKGRVVIYEVSMDYADSTVPDPIGWKQIAEFKGRFNGDNLGFDLSFKDDILAFSVPGGDLGDGTKRIGEIHTYRFNPTNKTFTALPVLRPENSSLNYRFGQSIAGCREYLAVSAALTTDASKAHDVDIFLYKLTKGQWKGVKTFKEKSPGGSGFVGNIALHVNAGYSNITNNYDERIKNTISLAVNLGDRVKVYPSYRRVASWDDKDKPVYVFEWADNPQTFTKTTLSVDETKDPTIKNDYFFAYVMRFADTGDLFISSKSWLAGRDVNNTTGHIVCLRYQGWSIDGTYSMVEGNEYPFYYVDESRRIGTTEALGYTSSDSIINTYGSGNPVDKYGLRTIDVFAPSSKGDKMLIGVNRGPLPQFNLTLNLSYVTELCFNTTILKDEVDTNGRNLFKINRRERQTTNNFSDTANSSIRQYSEKFYSTANNDQVNLGGTVNISNRPWERKIIVGATESDQDIVFYTGSENGKWLKNSDLPTLSHAYSRGNTNNIKEASARKGFVMSKGRITLGGHIHGPLTPMRVLVGSGISDGTVRRSALTTTLYEFSPASKTWKIKHTSPSSYYDAGHGLAISDDGEVFATSNRDRGVVRIFDSQTGRVCRHSWGGSRRTEFISDLITDPNGQTGDRFGDNIAMNADGSCIAVTSPRWTSNRWRNRGKVSIFEYSTKKLKWILTHTLETPQRASGDVLPSQIQSHNGNGMICKFNSAGNVLAVLYPTLGVLVYRKTNVGEWEIDKVFNATNLFSDRVEVKGSTNTSRLKNPLTSNIISPLASTNVNDSKEFVNRMLSTSRHRWDNVKFFDMDINESGTGILVSSYGWSISERLNYNLPATSYDVRGNALHYFTYDGYQWVDYNGPTLIDSANTSIPSVRHSGAPIEWGLRVGIGYLPEGNAAEAYPRFITGAPRQNYDRGELRVFNPIRTKGFYKSGSYVNRSIIDTENISRYYSSITGFMPNLQVVPGKRSIIEGDEVTVTYIVFGVKPGSILEWSVRDMPKGTVEVVRSSPNITVDYTHSTYPVMGTIPLYLQDSTVGEVKASITFKVPDNFKFNSTRSMNFVATANDLNITSKTNSANVWVGDNSLTPTIFTNTGFANAPVINI